MFQIRLRELREAAGYKSQQAFADAFGVAQSTVGNWEAGKRKPDHAMTIRLANFFNTTTDYLMGRVEQEEKPTPVSEDGLDPLDQRLNELLAHASEKTKLAMVAFLEQLQKP